MNKKLLEEEFKIQCLCDILSTLNYKWLCLYAQIGGLLQKRQI